MPPASKPQSPWPPIPQLVFSLLVLAVVGALVFGVVSAGGAFGAFNPTWEGTSELRTGVEHGATSEVVLSMDGYATATPSETIVLILSPDERYTPSEIAQIQQFLFDGGTIVVADSFGPHANPLLSDLGASARLDGAVLRDEIDYADAPTFPIAPNITAHPYTDGVDELTLNYGTAVTPRNADVLAQSSSFAYLDQSQSGNLTDGDPLGPHAVVTVETIGAGQVVTVSDPSLFINTMLSEPDNEAFATALIGSHEHLVLDYSHRDSTSPATTALVQLRQTPLLQGVTGLLAVGAVLLWHRRRTTRSPPAPPSPTWLSLRTRLAESDVLPTGVTTLIAPPPRGAESPAEADTSTPADASRATTAEQDSDP